MSLENLKAVIKFSDNPVMRTRIEGVMKEEAATFITSVINVARNNEAIANCDPMTVWDAAMKAASLKLIVEPSLGFAYIVPYAGKATFQIGYKGLTQLALRTGQYKTIHTSDVYDDEIESYDEITNKIRWKPRPEKPKRYDGKSKPCGYYAMFELKTGFICETYWSLERIMSHVKRFVKTYDKKKKTFHPKSGWATDFDAMGKKTALRFILTHYGIMSVEMGSALAEDEKSESMIIENPPQNDPTPQQEAEGEEILDTEPEPHEDEEQEDVPDFMKED
jgi:recombination protein RecT